MNTRLALILSRNLFPALVAGMVWAGAAGGAAPSEEDERIRRIVGELLKAKDQQLERLESRVHELEQLTNRQQDLIGRLNAERSKIAEAAGKVNHSATATRPSSNGNTGEDLASTAEDAKTKGAAALARLVMGNKSLTDQKTTEADDNGPKVGGFLDVTAQTKSHSNHTFNVGIVELDLDRIMANDHFGASAALNWYGYPEPVANIGAAFVDFHMFDNNIPVRGRIFQEPGFHLQAGKFDLPFSSDYQNFASRDRLTITPPMTTTRIERSGINPSNNGFNSIGVRSYGNWKNLSYTAFWVDSVYSKGTSLGGRLGGFLNNPYRLHRRSDLPIVDGGLSFLIDLDNKEQTQNEVAAVDVAFNYGVFRLFGEYLWRQAHRGQIDVFGKVYDKPSESGFHVTLSVDLEKWLARKVYVYGRYQEWDPRYDQLVYEGNGQAYRVGKVPMATVGFGYRLNDYLLLKVEYSDSLGREIADPTFQKQFGIAQLVARF